MIQKSGCKKGDFFWMFRRISKTGRVLVVDEGNFQNGKKTVQSVEYRVLSKDRKYRFERIFFVGIGDFMSGNGAWMLNGVGVFLEGRVDVGQGDEM
ncbi:MAG: hypothetical protein ABI690_06730 [Chloroflexota bacterium]